MKNGRKGHLINCLSLLDYRKFDSEGYVGLGPFAPQPNSTRQQVQKRLQILWDVIADLMRVQPGDLCFLHTEGHIYGPYIFKTRFLESASLPDTLRSRNLSIDNWLKQRENFDHLDYGYVAAIDKPRGCNTTGVDLMKLFLNQSMGIINSIPPRFKYGETKKIVKPLLGHEIFQLLRIIEFEEDWDIETGSDYSTEDLSPIKLDLNSYRGELYCEKILEAWFMQQMGNQHEGIINLIGDFDQYANSIHTYYTNPLDVIAYTFVNTGKIEECPECGNFKRNFANDIKVIELKKGRLSVSDTRKAVLQLDNYMNWARYVLNPQANVSGFIVSAGYSGTAEQYADLSNDSIQLLNYTFGENGLHLKKFT